MKKVAIIILHFSHPETTVACLDSLARLNTKTFSCRTLVVDNSRTGEMDTLKNKFRQILFIKNPANLGYAGGNNIGIGKALKDKADFTLIINNDTLLEQNLLVNILATMKKYPYVGVLSPKIYFAPGCEYHRQRYSKSQKGRVLWYAGGKYDPDNVLASHRGVDEVDLGQYDQPQDTDFVTGCAMLVRREVWQKIGLLNSAYFLYLEDVEFSLRAKKAGFRIFYDPSGWLWHLNAGSSAVGSHLQDYFITRNRLLLGMKWAPARTKLAIFKESLRLLLNGRAWQKRGVLDFYCRRLNRGSWPT